MPQTAQRHPAPAPARGGTERVLIADDEKNIRRAFAQAVEPLGLVAQTAASGEEALARLQEEAFGLMLLDLRLPGLDGLEVLEKARRLRPALSVIVLTAHGTPALAAEALERGAAAFAQKPFTPDEFRDVIRRTWGRAEPEASARLGAVTRPRAPRRVVVPVADPASQEVALRLAAAETRAGGELVVVNVLTLPRQTPLDHYRRHDDRRHDDGPARMQKLLLERARQQVRGYDVNVRTRALVARHAARALLHLTEQEDAAHLVLPWTDAVPEPKTRLSPLNTLAEATVRALARKAACEVTLVKENRLRKPHHLIAVVDEGPNAAYAVRRAFSFARSTGIARLKLLSVRSGEAHGDERAARAAGEDVVRAVAAEAGVPESKYEADVLVTGDGERALSRTLPRAVAGCDLVCVGAPARAPMTQTPFGDTPRDVDERLREGAALLVARGPGGGPPSLLERWTRPFSGRT